MVEYDEEGEEGHEAWEVCCEDAATETGCLDHYFCEFCVRESVWDCFISRLGIDGV